LLFCPPGGQFREYHGITAHLEPGDPSLYQRLLPPPLTVPSRPIVTLYVVDFVRVVPWPLTRYQEWAVLLKCGLNDEEGWFAVTMPVTKWVPMRGGRHIGFPKYVVDGIMIENRGDAAVATGTHNGIRQVEFDFSPGLTRPLAGWESRLMDDPSFFKGPQNFQLVPPGRGPKMLRITLDHVVEPHWSPRPGMVKARADPGEDWAGLIPEDSAFVGTVNHFVGGVNIVSTSVTSARPRSVP